MIAVQQVRQEALKSGIAEGIRSEWDDIIDKAGNIGRKEAGRLIGNWLAEVWNRARYINRTRPYFNQKMGDRSVEPGGMEDSECIPHTALPVNTKLNAIRLYLNGFNDWDKLRYHRSKRSKGAACTAWIKPRCEVCGVPARTHQREDGDQPGVSP